MSANCRKGYDCRSLSRASEYQGCSTCDYVMLIDSILISGDLDDDRLYRVLGELADWAAAPRSERELVLVIESDGGNSHSLRNFLKCALGDDRTRTALANADVKIYNAQSAAAMIALSFGRYRETAAGTAIVLHFPVLPVDMSFVDADDRLVEFKFESCRKSLEAVEAVMRRFGLDEPKLKSELHESGYLRLPVEECLKRGIAHGVFGGDGPGNGPAEHAEVMAHPEPASTTILISGSLTEQRLCTVLRELRALAARKSTADRDVVLVFDSGVGEMFSTMAFMEAVAQDDLVRHLVERASVKIYETCPPAALIAFSWGAKRELAAAAKVQFSLGHLTLQMGNPNQLAVDGRLSAQLCKDWRQYRSTVLQLMDRLGLSRDPALAAELCAAERLTLTAEECLKRGLVSRLF